MCLTAAGFCTAFLLQKEPRTVVMLTKIAAEEGFEFRDYDIRRALRELVLSKLVTQRHAKTSTKLLYSLTTSGRTLAKKNRKLVLAAFGQPEPEEAEEEKVEVKQVRCTNCGNDGHTIEDCKLGE
jgi:DNA-binding PadR family transcriptional regulator